MKARRAHVVSAALGLFVVSCALTFARQDRAQEVLARAREAIGGQARLAAVTALSVRGSERMTVTAISRPSMNRQTLEMTSSLEIDILLPDKFVITRDGPSGRRQVHGVNGTSLIMRPRPRTAQAQLPAGEPGVVARMVAACDREFLRYLVTWLLMTPERYGVRFSDDATGPAGKEMDVVEAKGASDFSVRLFFDRQSHLVMVTYQEPPTSAPPATPAAEARTPDAAEPLFKSIEGATPLSRAERRLHLADYRVADGITFPHRMTFESAGQVMQWEIKRFEVNPRLDMKRFQAQR